MSTLPTHKARSWVVPALSSSSASDLGLLLLRVCVGLSMALTHGRGTLTGLLNGEASFPDPLGLGPTLSMTLMAVAEFFCALAVVLGLATRLACIPLVIGLGVAFFIFHAGDPFGHKELAYLYLCVFAALALSGPGRWSVDAWLLRRLEFHKKENAS
ncbi:MAG TPA: DoxX family protein [Acidobacteriota bacterium]|nr:DoxX family protein [Acidobacteriota bacterium]